MVYGALRTNTTLREKHLHHPWGKQILEAGCRGRITNSDVAPCMYWRIFASGRTRALPRPCFWTNSWTPHPMAEVPHFWATMGYCEAPRFRAVAHRKVHAILTHAADQDVPRRRMLPVRRLQWYTRSVCLTGTCVSFLRTGTTSNLLHFAE